MNPILEQFLIEARENLLYLDKNLENINQGDDEIVNALFRAAHTLKGSSGLAGFGAVKDITHIAEDLLDAYRNNNIEYSDDLLDILYDMFDEVTELVDATEESGEVVDSCTAKLEEFKQLRSKILNVEEVVATGIDTELNIEDTHVPYFGHFFKNDFKTLELSLLPFDTYEITPQSFEKLSYYFVELDLSSDTLELGNDPFYSMYLLENENILSMSVEVISSCEDVQNNSLEWTTRIIALVISNQELLEDAFFNFMDEVTIYPLCVKSLFNSDLQPQSNELIKDFIKDLEKIAKNGKFNKLPSNLSAVLDIVNPDSLQGFLFSRFKYVIEEFDISDEMISSILNFIFESLQIDSLVQSNTQNEELDTIKEEPIVEEVEEYVEDITLDDIDLIEEIEFISEAEEIKTPLLEEEYVHQEEEFVFDLDEGEVSVIRDILKQQKVILNIEDNDNVVIQVKSILSKLESNLRQYYHLEKYNTKSSLEELVNNLLDSLEQNNVENQVEQAIVEKEIVSEEIIEIKEIKTDVATERKIESNKVQTKEISTPEIKKVNSKNEKKVKQTLAKTVKIELNDIDTMMDIVGEMLVIKNSLPYIAEGLNPKNVETSQRELLARYDEINRVTTALQEKVMEMRLLSLSFIFDRYPKLIRDISKSLGKKIKYEESGGDTKLDKTIIEKLADPLIHIIRNSLDHGIETPEERIANGKSPEGNISITAESIGDKVYVTIKDDGHGINVDKVVQSSLEKKMITLEEVENMSKQEKLLLVFAPGVSTMEEISELSGRGVGMDVVNKTIEDIGGNITMDSDINIGTKITLELPMSVALTNVFHVKLGNANYALSMDTITETVQVSTNEVEYVNRKPMLKLRGSLVPIIFNYNLLSKDIDKKSNYSMLIIETQGTKFGFVVDEFVNQLDIIQKPLADYFKNHPFISGTSLLGNGEVLFVINPYKLINLKEKK